MNLFIRDLEKFMNIILPTFLQKFRIKLVVETYNFIFLAAFQYKTNMAPKSTFIPHPLVMIILVS